MQEWLHNKKNLPIIIGLSAVIMVAAIVFILFQTGVLGGSGSQVASAPSGPVATSPGIPPSPPGSPGRPGGTGLPAPPGAPVPPGLARPGAPVPPGVAASPAAPAPVKVAAAPPVVGAPGARSDPFAGYVDYDKALKTAIANKPPPPRVDSFVPFIRITNYVPHHAVVVASIPTGQPTPSPGGPASIGRVSGVMLTNGAFAIVDNNGQSSILQPGDLLPNGGGRVISIQADSITVRTVGDQMVKVPISSGENASTPGGGPQAPPNAPGNIPQEQDENANGG